MSLEPSHAPIRKALGRVYIIMAAAGSLSVAIPELLNHFLLSEISLGPLPFFLLAATGAWATRVSSIGYGAVGGALVGCVLSLIGGTVFVILRLPATADAVRLLLSSVVITTVLGSALGTLGGLPLWLWSVRRRGSGGPY